jgi:hypothetical protein
MHNDKCGGTFFRVYEMTKKVSETAKIIRYAVNVKYRVAKRENIGGRYKTKIRPKEFVDLTLSEPSVLQNSNQECISINDNEDPSTSANGIEQDIKVAKKFINDFSLSVSFSQSTVDLLCPLCQEKIKRKLFESHLDGCLGFVQNVNNVKRKNQQIVRPQQGLQDYKRIKLE